MIMRLTGKWEKKYNEVSRGMWKTIETSIKKTRIGKTRKTIKKQEMKKTMEVKRLIEK